MHSFLFLHKAQFQCSISGMNFLAKWPNAAYAVRLHCFIIVIVVSWLHLCSVSVHMIDNSKFICGIYIVTSSNLHMGHVCGILVLYLLLACIWQ